MFTSYAAGVNAWLRDMRAGENGATLTVEYEHPLLSGIEIRDWEPEDTIALYLQLAFQLSETSADDLFRGEMATLLSPEDRKSTRLNSSHVRISYAVFCLKK